MDLSFPEIQPSPRAHAVNRIEHAPTPCDSCASRGACPGRPIALQANQPLGWRHVRRGQALFHSGEPFGHCWSVRTGSLKTSMHFPDGREQVTGFHFPGELLGADAIAAEKHVTTAVALADSTVCALPLALSPRAADAAPRARLWSAIAMAALREREVTALLASSGAQQRLAAFLLDLASRMQEDGRPARQLRLPMSRSDIASLLGISVETVSRSFTALARQGLIDVRRQRVRIASPDRLKAAAPPAPLAWLRMAAP